MKRKLILIAIFLIASLGISACKCGAYNVFTTKQELIESL